MSVKNNKQFKCNDTSQEIIGKSFVKQQLQGSDFSGVVIKHSYFNGANLLRSTFTKAYLKNNKFSQGKLQGIDFSKASYIQNNNFDGANLQNCNFSGCLLCGNSFIAADLRNANFSGTSFDGFDFKSAWLQGVNFTDCNIWNEIISYYLEEVENNFNWALHLTTKNSQLFPLNLMDIPDDIERLLSFFKDRFTKAEYDNNTIFAWEGEVENHELFDAFLQNKIGLVKKERRASESSPENTSTSRREHTPILIVKDIQIKREKIIPISNKIKRRLGQDGFRKNLLKIYRETCAITGEKVPGLEAAHIKPHSICKKKEQYDKSNGLLLRADVHTLFDLNLIKIHPDSYLVEIDPCLEGTSYTALKQKAVDLNANEDVPGRKYLQWRWTYYEEIVKNFIRCF